MVVTVHTTRGAGVHFTINSGMPTEILNTRQRSSDRKPALFLGVMGNTMRGIGANLITEDG